MLSKVLSTVEQLIFAGKKFCEFHQMPVIRENFTLANFSCLSVPCCDFFRPEEVLYSWICENLLHTNCLRSKIVKISFEKFFCSIVPSSLCYLLDKNCKYS